MNDEEPEEPIEDVIKFLLETVPQEYENDIKRLKKCWNRRYLEPRFYDVGSDCGWSDEFLRYWKQSRIKARLRGEPNWSDF